ncbi:hypothetical protein HO133_004157 [Letharia lupina]|uniref:Uncharacterized protein n=1 Tax=Letharia lupina TaxID=560253 RepID=A0A8H6C9Z1_9LECA|nr:uncharacterized protein HO133_004157 [Letharia lupina]KAF6219688.1 hypothetical protein HO133_004157 [Letharia lupina]
MPQLLAKVRHLCACSVYYSDSEHSRGSTAEPYDWQTWFGLWEILATLMPGLKKLKLKMEYTGRKEEVGVEQGWVEFMVGVKHVKI